MIRIRIFFSIPSGQKSTGSRIRIRNTGSTAAINPYFGWWQIAFNKKKTLVAGVSGEERRSTQRILNFVAQTGNTALAQWATTALPTAS
jgi:hypothetical protein